MLAMDGARGGSRLKDLTDQVTIELVKHSVAEEAEVYPRVQDRVSGAEAEHARHEHAEAEETMKRLERLEPTDARFVVELQTLIREVREHVAEEEGEMFPHMRTVFSEQELLDLAEKVQRVKKIAPTHPHPAVPNEQMTNRPSRVNAAWLTSMGWASTGVTGVPVVAS